jgi:uncharacterized protein YndB with AHSA1/START domain
MTRSFEPLLEQRIEIAAPREVVWELVGDVRRMAEWSPHVESTRLRAGFDQPGIGAEFTNLNRLGELEWKTRGAVVRYDPPDELAFRIADNWVIWSLTLHPHPTGTLLVQRRETPDGISDYSLELTEHYLGGQQSFTDTLRAGMRATLERIKSAAEASTAGTSARGG